MIILDTNILLAFLLTDGITRRIIAANSDTFMSPEYCFEELWEHRGRWNKNKLQNGNLLEIINDVKRLFVMAVSPEVYKLHIGEAEKLIDDKDDSPLWRLPYRLIMRESGRITQNISNKKYLGSA